MDGWLKSLEFPALILAAGFVLLQQRTIEKLTDQVEKMNISLSKLGAVVDLMCSKVLGGRNKT